LFGNYETPAVISKVGKAKLAGEPLDMTVYGRKEFPRESATQGLVLVAARPRTDLRFRAKVLLKDAKSRMAGSTRRGITAMPSPVALSDQQMMAILAAAAPLAAHDRNPFLLEVAQLLQTLPEVGDGALHRIIMDVQRRHFDPPELNAHAVPHRRMLARTR
jgi:hypothetical protein